MIEVSGVFLSLFRGIRRISGIIPTESSPCKDKSERSLLYLTISIPVGFSILVLILDKLFPRIDLYLSTVLTV